MHSTKVLFSSAMLRSSSISPRRFWEPMEMMTTSASFTQARSVDRAMDSGSVSRSLARVARNRCIRAEPERPYSVTRCPMRSRYQVISEPQRPQPMTVMFM